MNKCACGCGQTPKLEGSKFAPGHHFRARPRTLPTCKTCHREFAPSRRYRDAEAQYCSRECARRRGIVDITCENCGQVFEVTRYELTLKRRRFCSMKCRRAKEDENHLNGIGDISRIRPKITRARGSKCESCGYNKEPRVLVVHHLAGKGTSNAPSNLKLLCPTCHAEHHLALGQKRLGPTYRSV